MASDLRRVIFFVCFCILYFHLAPQQHENDTVPAQLANYLDLRTSEILALRAATNFTDFTQLGLVNVVKNNFNENAVPILPIEVSDEVQKLWSNNVAQSRNYLIGVNSYLVAMNAPRSLNFTRQNMPFPPTFEGQGSNETADQGVPHRPKMEITVRDKIASNGSCHGLQISIQVKPTQYRYLRGIYFEEDGSFYASTQSLKFTGKLALPFMLSQSDPDFDQKFAMAKELSLAMQIENFSDRDNKTLQETFEQESSEAELCELLLFGQLEPTNLSKTQLRDIEDELASPVGRPIAEIPLVQLRAYAVSPDCAEISYLEGSGHRLEVREQALRAYCTWAAALLFCLALSFIYQVKQYGSASQISKISFYSLVVQYSMDLFVAFITSTCIYESSDKPQYLPIMLIAGGLAYAEGRYLIAILTSQSPQTRLNAETDDAPIQPASSPTTSEQAPLTTPQEPAASRPTAAYTEDYARSLVYVNFGVGGLVFMGSSLVFIGSSESLVGKFILLTIYYSIWPTQIWLNYKQGLQCPVSLVWAVVSSVIRLIPTIYYFDSGNVLMAKNRIPKLCIFLVLYVGVQLLLLFIQSTSWWSNLMHERTSHSHYDYHPIILDLIDFTRAPSNLDRSELNELIETHMSEWAGQERHNRWQTQECVICLNEVSIVPPISMLTSETLESTRQGYAVTPCNHCFHKACLERWVHDRLQCPICRDALPAT